jgi:hypothetical protein
MLLGGRFGFFVFLRHSLLVKGQPWVAVDRFLEMGTKSSFLAKSWSHR